MTKMWKVVYGAPAPVEVHAENPTYPHRDDAGDQISAKTHFLDIDRAWVQLLAEHRSGLKTMSERFLDIEARLVAENKRLNEAAGFQRAAQKAFEDYLARVPTRTVA